MGNFIQKLKALLQSKFPKCRLELEEVRKDRVGGFLIWSGFAKMEQIERQRKLSSILKKNLSPQEQSQISAILTMTPEEMAFARQG
jgi:hypothetical protein